MSGSPSPLICLRKDMQPVSVVCFFQKNDRTYLICGTTKAKLYIWDLIVNRIIYERDVTDSIVSIHHYQNTSESYEIITQEKNGIITFYFVNDKIELIQCHQYQCDMSFCRSIIVNEYLVLPRNENIEAIELQLDSVNKVVNNFTKPLEQVTGYVMALLSIMIDSRVYLLGGYESGTILLWDFENGKMCSCITLRENITTLAYDRGTERIVVGNSSNIVEFIRIKNDFRIHVQCEQTLKNPGCSIIKIRPRGPLLLIGGWDGTVRIFSWKSLKPLAVLTEHSKSISDIIFSSDVVKGWDTHLIAVAATDGTVSLWNLY